MIISILGNIGSGKSLSVVRFIELRKQITFANFDVKNKNIIRLLQTHIISEEIERVKRSGEPVKKKKINWKFWNDIVKKHDGFDIVLDEVHNIVHSRMAMSKFNTLMTMWFSQIRKILGKSEKNHIYLISQRLQRIDVAFRDLIDTIIFCNKIELKTKMKTKVRENNRVSYKNLPMTFITQHTFSSDNKISCVDKFMLFRNSPRMARKLRYYSLSLFLGNPYYQFYDSYALVEFGNTAYL